MEWWLSLYVWNAEGACPQWHITERGGETLNMLSLRKAGDSVSVRVGESLNLLSLRKAGDSVSVRGVCGEWGGGRVTFCPVLSWTFENLKIK